ncbi:MAG: hypothetical protein PHH06_03590 [Candidatus Gracilibacteria bacterium]|nr:hypothetical protein [Candidatus Gracilibacteria bacterium]
MTKVDITYDKETVYYDALVLEKGIVTQAKSLYELVKNLQETFTY